MCRIQEKLFPYSKHTSIPFVVVRACVWERRCYWGEREIATVKWFKKDCEVLGDYSVYRCHLN